MSNVAVYLIIMLAVAAVIVIACVFAYNRRLDRITSGEVRDTHNSIPEPRTTVGVLYRVILMAVVILAFLSISAANGKLISLQERVNQLQSDQSSLVNEVRDLRDRIDQEKYLVAYSWWEYDGVDYDAGTVDMEYMVSLKEYSEDTAVTLELNGRSMPMERTSPGSFRGRFTLNLFDEYNRGMLYINENGTTRGESVEFPENIFWDFLPIPSYSCEFESGSSLGKMKYSGTYTVITDHPEEIESAVITYLSGDRELKTLDITEEVQSGKMITLEKGLDLEKDLTFRLELVTKTGFRIVQQTVMIYEVPADVESRDFLRILDSEGNTLWEDDYI